MDGLAVSAPKSEDALATPAPDEVNADATTPSVVPMVSAPLEVQDATDDDETVGLMLRPSSSSPDDVNAGTIVATSSADSVSSRQSLGSGFCCLCHTMYSRLHRRLQKSLAGAATTPLLASLMIPLLCLVAHYIFYKGQTDFMWRLTFDAQANVWYNATGYEAKTAFYALGLDRETHIVYDFRRDNNNQTTTVKEFTYVYAIQELWKANGMPGKTIPRVAAVLLILFSGIWPHLKLVMLSMTWLFSIQSTRRQRLLTWLSTLGKWSLADVLVVCVMVGVLNLDWTVDPTAIKNGFVYQVPLLIDVVKHMYSVDEICSYMLDVDDCATPPSTWSHAKCISCRNFVSMEFDHPKTTRTSFAGIAKGVQESGTGYARLRVEGMSGIYYFCVAVVLSILLSLAVDVLDARAQRRARVAAAERGFYYSYYMPLAASSRDEMDVEQNDAELAAAAERQSRRQHVVADDSVYELLRPSGSLSTENACTRYGLVLLSTVSCLTVILGAFVSTLGRRVTGAIPQLMHDIFGVAWDQQCSLQSLVGLTGAAGGWDWLLLATFALFVVVGPILRAVFCLVALSLPNVTPSVRVHLHTAIDYIGAFCAWEVVAVACYLVSLIMPVATSTIIMRPECAKVDASGSCLEVSFDLQENFWFILVGGALLVLSGYCCTQIMPHR